MAKTKSKIKTVTPDVTTREEFSELCGEIGALQTKLNARRLEHTRRLDELNKEFTDLETLEDLLSSMMKPALAWCLANEKTEFTDGKTLSFARAEAHFRIGNPEVKLRSGWKNEDVLKELRSFIKGKANNPVLLANGEKGFVNGADYIRTVEELNKQIILQDRNLLAKEEWFALGIKIVQERSLSITPKGEKLEDKQTIKEAA